MDLPRTMVVVGRSTLVRLSVVDTGPPPNFQRGTIVCIHGAGGDAEQWHRQIVFLRPNYRVVAPDLRGHGQSDAPPGGYSLDSFLRDFQQVLQALDVSRPFVLMAHSFGGPIAMTFAATSSDVSKLVLVATAPEIALTPVIRAGLRLPLPVHALDRLRPLLLPKLRASLPVMKQVLARTLLHWRGWDLLPQIKAPTLVIGGQFDFLVPPGTLQNMRAAMPNARFEMVRYAGHLPQLERPDAVNRYIIGFIERRISWRGEADDLEGGTG